jgi:hypothetical protein
MRNVVILALCYLSIALNYNKAFGEIDTRSIHQQVSNNQLDSLYIEVSHDVKIEGINDLSEVYRLYFKTGSVKHLVYKLITQSDSSIDYLDTHIKDGKRIFGVYAVYDNVVDGNRFLFFDYVSKKAFITNTCFAGFIPINSSVDFAKAVLLLRNAHHKADNLKAVDTLFVDKQSRYIGYSEKTIAKSYLTELKFDKNNSDKFNNLCPTTSKP